MKHWKSVAEQTVGARSMTKHCLLKLKNKGLFQKVILRQSGIVVPTAVIQEESTTGITTAPVITALISTHSSQKEPLNSDFLTAPYTPGKLKHTFNSA